MELRLTEEEADLLLELLQEHQTQLLRGIAKTDHYEFKAGLRRRCELLEGMLAKLMVPVP